MPTLIIRAGVGRFRAVFTQTRNGGVHTGIGSDG